jgi:phosphatidylserine/phosphatidylglycerophosphate/cardiolipin synthase-like enzyme
MATVLIETPGSQDRQHRTSLRRLAEAVAGTVRIASAYVTDTALLSGLRARDLRLLTYISKRDIVSGATKPESLIELIDAGVHCRYLIEEPKLHAKVYIFGLEDAVVTSANLTKKALNENLEVGVHLSGADVTQVVTWFDMLWNIARACFINSFGLKLGTSARGMLFVEVLA